MSGESGGRGRGFVEVVCTHNVVRPISYIDWRTDYIARRSRNSLWRTGYIGCRDSFFGGVLSGEGGLDRRKSGLLRDERDQGRDNDRAGLCGLPHLKMFGSVTSFSHCSGTSFTLSRC